MTTFQKVKNIDTLKPLSIVQSEQSLCFPLQETLKAWLSKDHPVKTDQPAQMHKLIHVFKMHTPEDTLSEAVIYMIQLKTVTTIINTYFKLWNTYHIWW